MGHYRIQTSLQNQDGLARDRYENTMYVGWVLDATDSQLSAVCDAVQGFYFGLAPWFSKRIGTGCTVKAYRMSDPKNARPPKVTHIFDNEVNEAASAPSLPEEVAVCLTYHAERIPTMKPQSNRGRIYLGPLNSTVLASSQSGYIGNDSAVIDGFRTAILAQTTTMVTAINNADGTHVISSNRWGRYFPVVRYSVDNSFDTQRSRGTRPTVVDKLAWPLTAGHNVAGTFTPD